MVWSYRTMGDGRVEVDAGTGFQPIELAGPDSSTKRTEGILELARAIGAELGVPLSWVLAVVYAESGGNPRVVSPDGGYGLMQLTPPSAFSLSKDQALEAEPNMRAGVGLLAKHRQKGHELPEVASMYNAGGGAGGPHPSQKSNWGMRETMPAAPWSGYIEKVVRASNWWRRRELAGELGSSGGSPLPGKPPTRTPTRTALVLPLLLIGTALYLADRRIFASWLMPGGLPGPIG